MPSFDHSFADRALPDRPSDIRAPQRFIPSLDKWQCQRVGLLLLSDALGLAIGWHLARHLNQFYLPLPPELNWGVWLGLPGLFWLFAAVTLGLFAWHGMYGLADQGRNYGQAGKLISQIFLLSLVVSYFYDPKLDAPRSLFFTAWLSSVALVIGLRAFTMLCLRQMERTQPRVAIFVIASPERLPGLEQALQQRSRYHVVGSAIAATASHPDTVPAILASGAREVLAEGLPQTELASSLYWQLRRSGVTLRLVPSSVELLHRRGVPEVIAGLPTLRLEAPLLNGWDYRLKRLLDVVGAAIGLLLLSPVFLGVALAIKLTSPGPVFFCQERMGLHGRVFQMWKFRTMVVHAAEMQATLEQANESGDGVMFKLKRDPRVTPIGRLLRRTSIDELPQLLNVLLGQMSLVGPRPLPLRDVARFDPWHHIRHQVLPGITGLWQISGRSAIESFADATRLDLYYIDHWSLNLDLDILLETLRIVLVGKGAY